MSLKGSLVVSRTSSDVEISLLSSSHSEAETLPSHLKEIITNTIPNAVYYIAPVLILTINIHFISIRGTVEEVDAVGLGNTWLNLTSFCIVLSLNSGTTAFISQAYGAKDYKLVANYFHKGLVLRILNLIPSYVLVLLCKPFFSLIGVEEPVAELAAVYCRWGFLALIGISLFDTLKSYIMGHSIFFPLMVAQLIATASHWGWCTLFVLYLDGGLKGAAIATGATQITGLILLSFYYAFSPALKKTRRWPRRSLFKGLWNQLKNESYVASFMYLEWMSYEICVVLAGQFPEEDLEVQVLVYNIVSLVFMPIVALSVVGTTVIGNALGQNNVKRAKGLMRALLIWAFLLIVGTMALLYVFRREAVGFYTHKPETIEIAIPVVIIYICCIPADFLQVLFSSIIKGIGKEKSGSIMFVIAFYCLGLPTACVLAFKFHLYAKGLWLGMGLGMIAMCIMGGILLARTSFAKQAQEVSERMESDRNAQAKRSRSEYGTTVENHGSEFNSKTVTFIGVASN